MTDPHVSNDERSPDPAGVDAGPQGGPGGAGGEPKGAALASTPTSGQAPAHEAQRSGAHRPEHSSDTAQPGYRARPAGQSGLDRQDDQGAALDGPQGDGNYLASDRGDVPLRNG